jgi:O-antigen ligase
MYLEQFSVRVIKLLIILLPIFLITGPFLTDLSASIVGLFFLIYAYKYKKLEYFKNYFFYYFCFVFFYLNIISLFSFDPKISLGVSLPFLRIILFIISLSFFFSEYKDLKFNILYIYIICLFLLFVDSIFQLYSGYNLFGFKMNDISRISSFFRDKYVMGSFVVRLLPFFLAISFFIINKKKQNIVSISILILSGLLVVLSGERVSFFYYLTLIFFYFFFLKNYKILIVYFIFYISLLVSLSFYNPNFINRIYKHTFVQLNEVKNFYNISYRHNLHYMTAYNIFLDNKLFGAGLKSFRYLCDNEKYSFSVKQKILEDNIVRSEFDGKFIIEKNSDDINILVTDEDEKKVLQERSFPGKYSKDSFLFIFIDSGELVKKNQKIYSYYEFKNGCNTHPHNIYLQFLSELGIIGFFTFLILFLYMFYNLYKLTIESFKNNLDQSKKSRAILLVGGLSSMLPFIPSGNYFGNWLMIITYLPFGFYISLVNKK